MVCVSSPPPSQLPACALGPQWPAGALNLALRNLCAQAVATMRLRSGLCCLSTVYPRAHAHAACPKQLQHSNGRRQAPATDARHAVVRGFSVSSSLPSLLPPSLLPSSLPPSLHDTRSLARSVRKKAAVNGPRSRSPQTKTMSSRARGIFWPDAAAGLRRAGVGHGHSGAPPSARACALDLRSPQTPT
jgi:hypothetical protein